MGAFQHTSPERAVLKASHSSAFLVTSGPWTLMNHGPLTAAKPSRFWPLAWWQNKTSSVPPSTQRMVAYHSRGSQVLGARPLPRVPVMVTALTRWEPSVIRVQRVARHLGPGRAGMAWGQMAAGG